MGLFVLSLSERMHRNWVVNAISHVDLHNTGYFLSKSVLFSLNRLRAKLASPGPYMPTGIVLGWQTPKQC